MYGIGPYNTIRAETHVGPKQCDAGADLRVRPTLALQHDARMMRWPSRLIVVGLGVLFASAAISLHGSAQTAVTAPPSPTAAASPAHDTSAGNGFAGSAACQRCHDDEYGSWRQTLHVQMTKPIGEARIEGDFRPGTHLEQNGRAYTMETRGGRYFISVANGANPPATFEINYTLGARRFQGYLSKLPDGRIYVMPVFWHNETKRWIDWREITPVPDDASHDLRQIWNVTCVNCHATNLVKNFDVATKTYATSWTEMGIGCEACHGPGRAHIALMDEWARNPSEKPKYDTSAGNRQLGPLLRIFSQRTASPRQVFDACGYCHGNKNNVFFGFVPGDRYEDYALPFLMSEPIPANDPQGDFWPDGRPSRFNRPQALMITGCFQQGRATCTSCHRAHGAPNDHMLKVPIDAPGGGHTKQSDLLCTQCHSVGAGEAGRAGRAGRAGEAGPAGETGKNTLVETTGMSGIVPPAAPATFADLSAHTHHAADSPGSRCVDCHMSDVNWRLFTRRRDHTFQPPVPEMTSAFGVPNACTTCHEGKTPEWAARTMDTWYGNGAKRRAIVAMANVMYRAGTGDTSALPDVARLAVDRSHGATIRASAAEFAGQLIARAGRAGAAGQAGTAGTAGNESPITPAVVNALIGATADHEPVVRVTAIRALAMTGDPRIAPVLASHLTDPARLARVSAADGLMALGITSLDGAAGEALSRAQDEWALSLASFNDVAADHTALGQLLAARGQTDAAAQEFTNAIALDPSDARPHVFLGVIDARAGRFAEALGRFKTAQKLDPAYQNLDRLISEAEKRRNRRD
jgi:predicted CXXCH cytochrome family protein